MKRGELGERFDANYHLPQFKTFIGKLKELPQSVSTSDLMLRWDRGDGPREGFYTDDPADGVPFIRINNLKEHSVDLSDAMLITRKVHENTLKRTMVGPGSLIFAVTGDLGAASIIPQHVKEANLNSALVRIELDLTRITQKFFCYFFDTNLARNQIAFIGKGAAQHNLNVGEIGQVVIPLPPLPIQEQLVVQLDAAREKRAHTLARAEQVLAGLDGFLLETLGLSKSLLKVRRETFAVRLSSLKNSRLDVGFHVAEGSALRNGLYAEVPLRELVSFVSGGTPNKATPEFWKGEIPWMSPKDFGPYILNDSEDHISEEGRKKAGLALLPTGSVLVVVRSGVLKHSLPVALTSCPVTINQDLKALTPHPSAPIRGDYLAAYLSIMGRRILPSIVKHSTTVQSLNTPQLEELKIPLPPLETQEAIATEVGRRREEARLLREDTVRDWDAAKAEFERQLLGSAE